MLGVLGRLGGDQPLAAVRCALKDENAEVRHAAIWALCNWPDAAPLEDLLAIAGAADALELKVLALQGIARQASLAKDQPVSYITTMLRATSRSSATASSSRK